ncbi:hypothetical protein [Sphingomonas sp. OTU376]|uniref:hypothetical protein n=1 Tax=Sphingomonas sp. OTU376 TaxID=3043863 RepID=UPI00313AFFAC
MIVSASENAPPHDEAAWRRDCIRRDWPGLAAAAEHLLAVRLKGDPAAVQAKRLTQLEAQNREATMRDLAAIWQAVVDKQDFPELSVGHAAIWADLKGAAASWAKIAAGRPGDQATADLVTRVEALAWYHQPVTDLGTPMIVLCHRVNQHWRQVHASRPAKPTPAPAPAMPPAPKLRQEALF